MAGKRVSARRLEWARDETFPKGERWEGSLDGRAIATVTLLSEQWGGREHYRLELGALSTGGNATSLEAGQRAAQQALSKAVRSLMVLPVRRGLYG